MPVHPSITGSFFSKISQSLAQEISIEQCSQSDLIDLINVAKTKGAENQDYNNYYFQILEVKLNNSASSIAPSHIETKLVTQKKTEFNKHDNYPVIKYNSNENKWEREQTIGVRLPAHGVIVKEEFLPIQYSSDSEDKYLDNLSKYPTVRFMLQCRRLSQLMAKTWLPETHFKQTWEKDNVRCIREIFLSANIKPDTMEPDWDKIPTSGSETDYIIKPDSLSQQGIRLSLLLSGQAYRWVNKGEYPNQDVEGYLPICDSLYSTYETIYEYALKVSWDTFYASRIDVAQSGLNEKPPYYEVTLGYPPRPSLDECTTLTEEKIATWVNSAEDYQEGSHFPFYPPKNDHGQYESDKVRYMVPPYPYLPLSCS